MTGPKQSEPSGHWVYRPTSRAELDALMAEHRWMIEADYKMCMDQFEREFWRGLCSCGVRGKRWRFWRSQAQDDYWTHLGDIREAAHAIA